MSPEDTNAEAKLELLRIKQKIIKKIPERLAIIFTLAKRLEDMSGEEYSEDYEDKLSQAIEELELAVHSMIGSLGSLDLEWEMEQTRLLNEQINKFKGSGKPPSKYEWERFYMTLTSLKLSVHRISLGSFTINSARKELRPGKGDWVVDDDPDQSEVLCNWFQHEGYQTRSFLSLDDFIDNFDIESKPDIIFMDMRFREGEFAGAEKISSLQVKHGSLPPLIFMSVQNSLEARLMAFRAGATRYLMKPLEREYLISLVDELSSEVPPSPYKVHLVDDDEAQLKLNQFYLELAGFHVSTSYKPLRLIDDLKRFQPDVVVLDVYMPEASGPELAAVLKEMPEYRHLPVLFLSSAPDPSTQLLALGMGGDEYLIKPVQPNRLVACLRKHARKRRLREINGQEKNNNR